MNKIITWVIGLVALVALVIGSVALVGDQSASTSTLGASTPGTRFPHGITIGLPSNSPTNIGDIKVGTCNLLGMDASQAASSTASYDCAVTGVVSGDLVFAALSTTTSNTSVLNWAVTASKASTTAGFITLRVSNFSGAAVAPSISAVGSSTQYIVVKTQ